MIILTRLNGTRFGINDEQIERLEDGPNAVVVLVNGNRYTALESLDDIVDAIVDYRARVLNANALAADPSARPRSADVALFRSHSILADVEPAHEIDDSPIPGRKPSVMGTFLPRRSKKD